MGDSEPGRRGLEGKWDRMGWFGRERNGRQIERKDGNMEVYEKQMEGGMTRENRRKQRVMGEEKRSRVVNGRRGLDDTRWERMEWFEKERKDI